MCNVYPVHYSVTPPARFTRLQLFIRLVAFCAIGVIGLSFGMIFMFGYLALAVFAATRLASRQADEYLAQDGPRIVSVLRWFAAISAWTALIAEHLPGQSPDETVRIEIEPTTAQPTPSSAIWRVVSGIPSALVLGLLCWIGMFVWLWAALSILVAQRVGPHASAYLVGLQRWSIRLLAYQASLVDQYPPFSLSELAPLPVATARLTP
jgi:hypothetical protein